MDTKRDICTRKDIQHLLEIFYEKVKSDEVIGIIFTEIVPINWEHHIPLITDFWETILLDNPVYKNNAMEKHFRINEIYPLKKEHFDAWIKLFHSTIDELYAGRVASLAKVRAESIAKMMQFKMTNSL